MPEPEVLIQRYLEGRLREDEADALLQKLQSNPALATSLLEHLELDAMLRQTVKTGAPTKRPNILMPQKRYGVSALAGAAAVAALTALVAVWSWENRSAKSPSEATTASVAVLSRGANLVWEDGGTSPAAGALLSPGWLRIKSGLAQIEFYQGARVSIEGPAALKLISAGEAFVASGKLSAHVPPQAKGFRINTAKGSIVDLGTEFGVNVTDAGAEVHVFDGEVELHPESAAMQPLKGGEAMKLQAGSSIQAAQSDSFASLMAIDAQTAAIQQSALERWMAKGKALNAYPSLLLRFDFQEETGARLLRNQAFANQPALPDGSIVACAWTQGRWPGKRALEFRQVSDRVRVSVPGELAAFTFAAWVRIDGLDRTFNSLFMSEGWGERRVHWQITREGAIRLGVAGARNSGHHDYDSPRHFTPERFGQWMHLAVTFDAQTQQVVHYADGEPLVRTPLQDASPVRIGLAELGNWNDHASQGSRVAIRHLSGAMDEFVVWNRALSAAEVSKLSER